MILLLLNFLLQSTPPPSISHLLVVESGTLKCSSILVGNNVSLDCTISGVNVLSSNTTVPPVGSIVTSFQSGVNHVTLLVTKGNPSPDRYELVVSDGVTTKNKMETI